MYADKNVLYFNEDSNNAVFNCNETVILNSDLNNIILDNNFDKDNPDTIIQTFNLVNQIWKTQGTKKKISKELMPPAWHPNRWWNFCMPEEEKK